MSNTYPTKTAMQRSKKALPQASPRGGVRHRARRGAVLTRSTLNELWYITWDPTESPRGLGGGLDKPEGFAPQGRAANGVAASHPVATRPLAIQKDGTWYTYGLDLPKNITEAYGTNGGIKTAYTYTPYGQVTASGSVTQCLQWSSEYADTDLGLVYYNYRHYNPLDGRWTGRDQVAKPKVRNLYVCLRNTMMKNFDVLGLDVWVESTASERTRGLHWRVCVDVWEGPLDAKPSDVKGCCVDGKWYKKQGKYCISFGLTQDGEVGYSSGSSEDGGASDNDSSGDSSISGDEQTGQDKSLSPFPPGIDGPDPKGDGSVYLDMNDPAKEEKYRSETGCCEEDMAIMQYFQELLHQRANYALLGQNCRDFSEAAFDYCKNKFSDKCK